MDKKELELLESIKNDMSKIDGIAKDQKEAKEQAEKNQKELELQVKKLNEDNAEKGATLKDIQEEVMNLKAKQGKVGAFKAHGGDYRETLGVVKSSIIDTVEKNIEKFEAGDKAKIKLDLKASTMTSASLSGNPYFNYLPAAPGQRPFGQTRFRDLAPTYQSATDNVLFPRQGTAPNSGTFNYQSAEGAAKPLLDYAWSMQTVTLRAFAGTAKVSRQSLRNIPFLQSYLPQNLLEDLLDKEDLNFSATLYAGSTGSTTITPTVDVEQVLAWYTNLMQTKFIANGIAIDPAKWLNILITKPQNYSLPNVVTIDTVGNVRVLGIPMYPVNWLTGGKIIIGDWTKVGIVESEGLTMRQTDSDGTDFSGNILTFLLERTENLAIFRPDAFIATTLT